MGYVDLIHTTDSHSYNKTTANFTFCNKPTANFTSLHNKLYKYKIIFNKQDSLYVSICLR